MVTPSGLLNFSLGTVYKKDIRGKLTERNFPQTIQITKTLMSSPTFQSELDAENKIEAIEIAITAGDFTTAGDLYESFESWNSVLAKEYLTTLSLADVTQLRVALEKN